MDKLLSALKADFGWHGGTRQYHAPRRAGLQG